MSVAVWVHRRKVGRTDIIAHPLLKALSENLDAYLARHPVERDGLQPLLSGLTAPDDLWDRTNMDGHLTATALVLANQDRHVFMIHHKVLNRWLAPGGHVDPGEMPETAAFRELEEETGLVPVSASTEPIDIDIHAIPARPAKNEGAHFHFDFRYVMRANSKSVPVLQGTEIAQGEWQDLEALQQAYPRVYHKLTAA